MSNVANQWKKPDELYLKMLKTYQLCLTNRQKSQLKRLKLSEKMNLEFDERKILYLLPIYSGILPERYFLQSPKMFKHFEAS